MQILRLYLVAGVSTVLLFAGCGKDKNMDDYRREQLQESIARISSISGSYSGGVISKMDGNNIGTLSLKFKASTDVQANSGRVSNEQNAIVSGLISLSSLMNIEVAFDNGHYDDVTGNFQVTVPVNLDAGLASKVYLNGHISGDKFIGSIEVKGQSQNGAELNLIKNAPPANTSKMEVSGIRLEQLKRLNYNFEGSYLYNNKPSPFILSFVDRDFFPEQNLYKLFSPIRQVGVNCDLGGFRLDFSNAILDDKNGTLVAFNPTDQRGNLVRGRLNCNNFEDGAKFGWNCELKTTTFLIETHLIAVY